MIDVDTYEPAIRPFQPPAASTVGESGESRTTASRIEGFTEPVLGEDIQSRGASVSKYKMRLAPDFIGQGGGLYFSTGFGITPEVRYYLSKKNPAPRGIYLAPNYRYQKLDTENLEENSEATVITSSIAINLGYQLVLKDRFLVDAWVGLAYNFRNVVDETVPGAQIGPNSENGFGARVGVAVGLAF